MYINVYSYRKVEGCSTPEKQTQVLFQLLLACWDSEQVGFAGALKDGGLVSHSPQALLKVGPAGFHTQVLGTCLPRAGLQGWQAPQGTWIPPLLGVTFSAGLSLPLWSACQGSGLWLDHFSAPPAVLIWPFPYILGCGTSVLLSSGHPSSEIVVSYAVVVLVCLWEEVSSGFSSSLSWSGILKELKLFSSTCWFPTSVNILKNGCHTSKLYPF